MIEHLLHPRIVDNKDWATILFVFSFVLITITKSTNENRFSDFMNLIFSDKYSKVYRNSGHLISGFTLSLFVVQAISFAFFIQLALHIFGFASKTDYILYIQILTFVIFFILSKYLIEKIIGTAFNIEEFVEQFNLQKVTYRTYIGLLILPFNIILFYHESISTIIPQTIIVLLVIKLYLLIQQVDLILL